MSWSRDLRQFQAFCCVGGAGFVVDVSCFALLSTVCDATIIIRMLAFWVAASATWWGNRVITFAQCANQSPLSQWYRHMLSAHVAGVLNVLTFSVLLVWFPVPVAFCSGVLAGLVCNFFFASHFVFAPATPRPYRH